MMTKRSEPSDFWARVRVGTPDECWDWTGAKMPDGYGQLRYQGRKWYAHRLAVFLTRGEQPEAVCHACDRRPCCNPAHLVSADQAWNVRDAFEKRRVAGGTRHGLSRLTSKDLTDIRRRLAKGETRAFIAKLYGYHPNTIHKLARGETYRQPARTRIADRKG